MKKLTCLMMAFLISVFVLPSMYAAEVDGKQVRYIRNTAAGFNLTPDTGYMDRMLLAEIQAIDVNGVNQAAGKIVTLKYQAPVVVDTTQALANVTDGKFDTYIRLNSVAINNPVITELDLGAVMDIKNIVVSHFTPPWNPDEKRTYKSTKLEVSVDSYNWEVLYDSSVLGPYVEVASGKSYPLTTITVEDPEPDPEPEEPVVDPAELSVIVNRVDMMLMMQFVFFTLAVFYLMKGRRTD